jgi:hypothetical protein
MLFMFPAQGAATENETPIFDRLVSQKASGIVKMKNAVQPGQICTAGSAGQLRLGPLMKKLWR